MEFKRRDIIIALIGTLALHAAFLTYASWMRLADHDLSVESAKIFNVSLIDLQESRRFNRDYLIAKAEKRPEDMRETLENQIEPDWPSPVLPNPIEPSLEEPDVVPDKDPTLDDNGDTKVPGPESILPTGMAREEMDKQLLAVARNLQRPELPRSYVPIGTDTGPDTLSGEGGTGPGGVGVIPGSVQDNRNDSLANVPFEDMLATMSPDISGMEPDAPAIDAPPEDANPELASVSRIELPDVDSIDALTRDLTGNTIAAAEQVDDYLDAELYVYRPGNGDDGYFMLSIQPKPADGVLPVMPKDIIFVIDASASMGSRTFEGIKEGIKGALIQVRPEDTFNVVGFRRRVMAYQPARVAGTDVARGQALSFVDGLETSGSTDIYGPLYTLALADADLLRPFMVVLFSDGRPTAGERNSQNIINSLTDENNLRASFFAFGAGTSVNRYLLDLLTRRNKGYARFSEDVARIREEILRFYGEFSDPVLVRLNGNYGRIDESRVYPKNLPDLYRGSHLRIYGRFGPDVDRFNVGITGLSLSGRKSLYFLRDIPKEDNAGPEIAQAWGYHAAYDVIERICERGVSPERVAELDRLRKKYEFDLPYQVDLN